MPGSQHGPSIKNPKVYEALRRRRGMSKSRAAAISNAMVKDSAGAGLAVAPHGAPALFNSPGIGNIRTRRRRTKATPNWGAKRGETIIGGLGRGEGGRFSGSGQPSAKRQASDATRAARRQRAEERRAAREAELAQEETTRAEEDAYIAAGATGRERQRRRAEVAAARRQRAAERRARRQQEVEAERTKRAEEDAAAEAEEAKGGGGGGGGKKKPTDEEKRAEQEKKAAANRATTAPKVGLSTAEAEFLAAAASGTLPPGSFDAGHLMALGLVADTGDTTEATDAGRRALNAMERGDVRGALAAIQDGKARVAREAERAERTRQRETDKKRRDQERADRSKLAERTRQERQRRGPARPAGTTPAEARIPDPAVERARNQDLAARAIRNLERRRAQRARAAARRRGIGGITNIERQNQARRRRKEQRTFGGEKRADLRDEVFAGPDRSFPIVTAQDVRDAVRSLGRTKHDKAAVRRGIIRRARAIGAMDALPEAWKTEKSHRLECAAPGLRALRKPLHAGGDASIPPSFTIFKDSAGRDRWLAITTTAYEDKDREFITRKAIRGVVAAGDAGASRGPLRFWHVPGLDLGDCDYQASAFGDRVLIESGTFRSPAAARIGQAAAAKGYAMSPGFLHTRREPRDGRFDHIALFERSFVPPGRASNPYTRLLTKETRMLTDEKRKEFEALAADPEARTLLETLLSQAETTVKAADAAGAVYKDAPAWAQALIGRIDALEATVKAPMPPEETQDIASIQAGETEADDGMAELEAEAVADEPPSDVMDDEGFANLIVEKLIAAIGPMLELEKKMTGYLGEMKAMLAPQTAKDDARAKELSDLQAVNAALDARLKELEGGVPRGARGHYAAGVWADLTGQVVTKELAAQISAQPGANDVPAGLSEQERGAYQLIYGNS